jgi:TolB-like protein/DNA-binding winged helix-turn-helix (wHTH) protein
MRDSVGSHFVEPLHEAAAPLHFAGLVLDLDACTLTRDSGEPIPLTRGELALLRMFVTRPGRVLSRDALLDAFTRRRFEPFDRSVDVLVGKLRRKIEPDPQRPSLIVTVPGEGYRFDGLTQLLSPGHKPFSADPIVLGAESLTTMTIPPRQHPPRLSIVVLPFSNIGGDLDQEYFTDGVTESLTTDLSRIRGAVVIARNTAFTYRAKSLDVKTIGRELNVRYVLEGSFQRGGSRMRVNVQLIDAETGDHLWAERFDKPLADLFDVQDEIVARLAGALNAQLVEAEARRAERTPTPDSMDLYFQGLASFNRGLTPERMAEARSFFNRALSLDANNVDALVGAARVDHVAGAMLFVADHKAAFASAEAKAANALSLVPDHARGHLTLGMVYLQTRRAALGIAEMEHALLLDRNLAQAHASIGLGKSFTGRANETEVHVMEALRLSPRDPFAYIWLTFAGLAKNYLGFHDDAVRWFQRAIEVNRNYSLPYFHLGAALARLGRSDEAHSAVKAGLALHPSFTIAGLRDQWRSATDNETDLALAENVYEGMRMAGVREE